MPALVVNRRNETNANETNHDTGGKTGNRMEQTTQTGTQTFHNRRGLLGEALTQESGTKLLDELDIALQHRFHVGIAIVTRYMLYASTIEEEQTGKRSQEIPLKERKNSG